MKVIGINLSTLVKKAFYWAAIILLIVTASTVVNSHYRPIQEKIHQSISWVYKQNQSAGNFLYEANALVFNGRNFDYERTIKNTIFSSFSSVVLISVHADENNKNPFLQRQGGTGTGFFTEVTNEHALVVTNYHVIQMFVENPSMTIDVSTISEPWPYSAEVVGYDKVADIAVIKIHKKDNEEWTALEFEDHTTISEGDPVVVIGHGLSMPWNITTGIVTYDGRMVRPYSLMLQTDAVINQGNSGGPLLSTDGKVIGVAQSILSPGRQVPGWDGVGIAVHVRQLKRSYDYILSDAYAEKGYVPYAEFPISAKMFEYEDVKDIPRNERNFIYIDYTDADFTKPSAGSISGLNAGDIVLELNGNPLQTSFALLVETLYAFPGDKITLKVLRDEQELEVELELLEADITELLKKFR